MAEYTFHTLSDADFEDLACDLLGAELGISFQPFIKGRDSGIDLLHGSRIHGETIVQCKHYCRSKYSSLKSTLNTKELPKLTKLNPSRFIVATSLGLTPKNKLELLTLLSPYCKGINDIYGMSDFNALLRKHTTVETAHYKLWLTSVPVLKRMLCNGTAVWNTMTKNDMERKMSLYVQTDAYSIAMNTLTAHNYCILSGIPGIGKTTLAQVLVTRLMEDGYELIAVRDDIQEAFDMLDITKKQVVYYDDFLGQSSINEKLGKNEDRGISRLLTEATRTKHLKVIFTTREYILKDAKRVYEPLNHANIDVAKCIIEIEDYTRGHRARILYNHVYFSGLSHDYACSLLKDRGYRRIIEHKGYSPRIVEWMTLGAGTSGVPSQEYVDKFVSVLDDPAQLWQHAFDNQINDDARAILYTLGSVEGWIGLNELRAAWRQLRGIDLLKQLSIESNQAFNAAMKQLEGSFTRSTRVQSETAIEFHNPSIKDYVRRRIVGDIEMLQALLNSALYFEQVACIVSLSSDGRIGNRPSGLIPDGNVLHKVIRQTLDTKSKSYEPLRSRSDGTTRLASVDFGVVARLAQVATWAKQYQSRDLFHVCFDIATEVLANGEAQKASILANCEFLGAIMKSSFHAEQEAQLIKSFITLVDRALSDDPSVGDWIAWTECVQSNKSKFSDDDLENWIERAVEFCEVEIDAAIDNAKTSADLENWYGQILEVADGWDLKLHAQSTRLERTIERLQSYEKNQDQYEDWRDSRTFDPTTDDAPEIDRLFDSLNDKASD